MQLAKVFENNAEQNYLSILQTGRTDTQAYINTRRLNTHTQILPPIGYKYWRNDHGRSLGQGGGG